MPEFSRVKKYQFGMFLAPGAVVEHDRAVEIMTRVPPGSSPFSLRLNRLTQAQVFAPTADGQFAALPALSFSGPPLWRFDISAARVDLSVDAQGYEDTAGKPLLLDEVRKRIVPNLAELVAIPVPVNRLTLLVHLQAATPDASALVAGEFMSEAVQESVRVGEALDVTARCNMRDMWKLAGAEVAINRIEAAESAMQYGIAGNPWLLNWQFDVNTSPLADISPSSQAVQDFFLQAVEWVNARISQIQSH